MGFGGFGKHLDNKGTVISLFDYLITIIVIVIFCLILHNNSAVPLDGAENNIVNNIFTISAGQEFHHVSYRQNRTRQEILAKMATSENITCPEINNVTFTNDPPYDILGIPQCQVKHKAALYLNKVSYCFTE